MSDSRTRGPEEGIEGGSAGGALRITGSSPHAETTSFGTESWMYKWSFHAIR
jgi:hypothetical protein